MTTETPKTPRNGIPELPVLGSGLGYRSPWFEAVMERKEGEIGFLEITADHYLEAPEWKLAELDALSRRFTLIPHALDLSLGSAEGIDEEYLGQLAELIERLNPPYWSEHLAFTKAGGRELGHLAPLPFCSEAIEIVARNVEQVREYIDRPLILENITYDFKMPGSEMSEPAFLKEVFDVTGCGWLLDVTNLHVNSINHGEDAREFLQASPLDRVVQLHYVGYSRAKDGRLIDDHGTAVNEEIWELMEAVLEDAPAKGAILERDQHLPVFAEIQSELERAREIGRRAEKWT